MTDTTDETIRRLDRAVRKLTPMQREVFFLVRIDGLTYPEITDRLGITPAKVERHLAAALYRLDKELERPEKPWWRVW